MKKSDIEKQLNKDLSASAPSDFSSVWNKCTTPASEETEYVAELATAAARERKTGSQPSRKAISLTAVAVTLLLALTLILCLTLPGKSDGGFVLPLQSGYFIVDVNPSVKVNYDVNGVVTLAQGLNDDGDELLDGLELQGLTYDKAADAIFDRCFALSYFSAERDDNAILMTASKDNGEKDDKITEEINKLLTQKFADKMISGTVISDVDNEKGQKDAEKYGISGQKYELIQSYLNMGGTLDESEYATITIRELYSFISEIDKNDKEK